MSELRSELRSNPTAMPDISIGLQTLATDLAAHKGRTRPRPIGIRLANALQWAGRDVTMEPPRTRLACGKALIGHQPAAVFGGTDDAAITELVGDAAFFAYHSSIEWGLVANADEIAVFNSHWVRSGSWFSLPSIKWARFASYLDILEAMTPEGLSAGKIDKIASRFYAPDKILTPVDDSLVDRLDYWRDEAVRLSVDPEGVDERIHNAFAQFFVLRAVEDRKLAREIPALDTALGSDGRVDLARLTQIFELAQERLQSDLFRVNALQAVPNPVLAGIIHDLYYPRQIPIAGLRYNFAWLDVGVLGQVYEKYLSNLPVPSSVVPAQMQLINPPLRGVERLSTRKLSGVYYTPKFLVDYLTASVLGRFFSDHKGTGARLPRVADFTCGSGSFLTSAVDYIIGRCRVLDPAKNWGRELIKRNLIVGIDEDPRAVTLARLQVWLRLAEEPDPLPLPSLNDAIKRGDSLGDSFWRGLPEQYDVVLGNPPFMPVGKVHSRADLAKRFKTAQGRFDFAYLFVELAFSKLRKGGILGLVVPNRLFRNRDASSLRQLLTDGGTVLGVTDFGSNQVFSGTSSYIGTIVVEKRPRGSDSPAVRFTRVFNISPRFMGLILVTSTHQATDVRNSFVKSFNVAHPKGPQPWLLLSQGVASARARLEEESDLLGTVAGIYQGIKVGTNDVFIVTAEMEPRSALVQVVNGLGESHVIESRLLHPVVFGSDIQRYARVRPNRFIIYPYRRNALISEEELREQHPYAHRYLSSYKGLLAGRTSILQSGRQWYELVRQRDEEWLNAQKLLMRDLAMQTAFALDDRGDVFLVGGTAVVPEDSRLLLPLLAYLNSQLVHWYLNPLAPTFRADFIKIEPQHLQQVPVLRAVTENADLGGRLAGLAEEIIAATERLDEQSAQRAQNQVNTLLCQMIGIDPTDIL